jgi:glucose 1-dehydrogenase
VRAQFDFQDHVALVTGASSGIGQGIAVAFGQAGADVVVNYNRDAAGAEATAAAIRAAGRRALAVQADVGDPAAVERLFAAADAEFGRLDALVNNAGIAHDGRPLHETPPDAWDKVLRANLDGPFYCAAAAARRMIAAGRGGRIVNITSVHEEACNVPGDGPYHASKGGLRNLTRALALELAEHRITVNNLAPGMILTPMNHRAQTDPEYLAWAESQVPLRRAGTPADIANMALFLCSDAASYCTGGTYLVDGGWLLTWPHV